MNLPSSRRCWLAVFLFGMITGCNVKSSSPSTSGEKSTMTGSAPVANVKQQQPSRPAPSGLGYFDEVKSDRARLDIHIIERACQAYYLNAGEMPATLTNLIEGEKRYLEGGAQALLDPWGKPYQFTTRLNQREDPEIFIWTLAPNRTVLGKAPPQ